MMIYIDISEMVKVSFVSGIQRVVREVTSRWLKDDKKVTLLSYDFNQEYFRIIDSQEYLRWCERKNSGKDIFTNKSLRIDDFDTECIFFDMDSVWMNPLKRSYLLPRLKERGVKIAAHIYDIIPVTEPFYCHELTVLHFLEYIEAQIEHSDMIIANAQATIDAINKLTEGTDRAEKGKVNGKVVRLGADIRSNVNTKEANKRVEEITSKGKYVLMVGTMEPRKNHKFVLDAFEQGLFEKGINLVFAGRVGWNMEDFLEYIQGHKLLDKQFFYVNNGSDADITYLYNNALLVAFPSFNEGFGLPIIEAYDHGTPVLAANIPVLREVGLDFCEYFDLDNSDEFIRLVTEYAEDEEKRNQIVNRLKEYKKVTWDECARDMYNELSELISFAE